MLNIPFTIGTIATIGFVGSRYTNIFKPYIYSTENTIKVVALDDLCNLIKFTANQALTKSIGLLANQDFSDPQIKTIGVLLPTETIGQEELDLYPEIAKEFAIKYKTTLLNFIEENSEYLFQDIDLTSVDSPMYFVKSASAISILEATINSLKIIPEVSKSLESTGLLFTQLSQLGTENINSYCIETIDKTISPKVDSLFEYGEAFLGGVGIVGLTTGIYQYMYPSNSADSDGEF